MSQLILALFVGALNAGFALPSSASVGLANPAAEYCVANGGFFGLRENENGQYGVCILANGEEVDAWDYFRDTQSEGSDLDSNKLANPAATYCGVIGGTYDLQTSMCQLPDGSQTNAWDLLREAHAASASLANPAATYCIQVGGTYEVRSEGEGQVGMCKLEDGREVDAWLLFRESN